MLIDIFHFYRTTCSFLAFLIEYPFMLRSLIEHHETKPGVGKALDSGIAYMSMNVTDRGKRSKPSKHRTPHYLGNAGTWRQRSRHLYIASNRSSECLTYESRPWIISCLSCGSPSTLGSSNSRSAVMLPSEVVKQPGSRPCTYEQTKFASIRLARVLFCKKRYLFTIL